MDLRKISCFQEVLYKEAGEAAKQPVTRVCAVGIIRNPFAGQYIEDLATLFDLGEQLGERLTAEAMKFFDRPITSYGKAALVGVSGDIEHAHAMLHPKLGKQMRAPIGGGAALIPSSAKIGVSGCSLDIPLGHKDDAWSFNHFDAMTISLPDSPRPDELALVVAFADGGRLNPRCGDAPAGR